MIADAVQLSSAVVVDAQRFVLSVSAEHRPTRDALPREDRSRLGQRNRVESLFSLDPQVWQQQPQHGDGGARTGLPAVQRPGAIVTRLFEIEAPAELMRESDGLGRHLLGVDLGEEVVDAGGLVMTLENGDTAVRVNHTGDVGEVGLFHGPIVLRRGGAKVVQGPGLPPLDYFVFPADEFLQWFGKDEDAA